MDVKTGYPTTPDEVEEPFLPRWPAVALVAFLIMAGILVGLWQVSLPYYALSPGPVSDVEDLIEVVDQPTFAPDGDLYMLTVSLQEVNAFEWVQGYFDSSIDLVEREIIRPSDVSPDEFRRANRDAMDDSKNTAISVALQYLGYDVQDAGEGVLVRAVLEGTPADGVLEAGDVITAVDGVSVTIRDDGINQIVSHEIGETVRLEGLRGDGTFDVEVTLIEHTEEPGRPMVGFQADTYNRTLVFPFEIDIDSQNVGGPSAGMMYAVTIIDLLTEEDLTGGNVIAGTGTIASDGTVGPIGGIRQKVVAAQAAGATHILVPTANYPEALLMRDAGVEIHSIATLDDAISVLEGLSAA